MLSLEEELKAAGLKPQKIYYLSAEQEAIVKAYLEENLKRGFIRLSKSPIASLILLVPKKNSK